MNTFFAIIRWCVGLFLGFVLFLIVLVTIPLSIAGRELFTKESGMAWLTSFASDKVAVTKFVDGTLSAVATSEVVDDPTIKDALKVASDADTPLGSALRKVLTPESVGENLLTNASSFYAWLDGDKPTLTWSYKLGGTITEQTGLVSAILRYRYESLPSCTSSERKELGKIDANSVLEAPCSAGALSQATFDAAAKKMMSEPEVKKILAQGFSGDAKTSAQERSAVLEFKTLLSRGVMMTWLAIIILSLFMIVLFVPQSASIVTTGVIVGMTGLALSQFGRALGAVAEILKDTIGNEIAKQGMYIGGVGLIMVIGSIIYFSRKKPQQAPESTH